MYTSVKQFEQVWNSMSTATLKMLNALTDESLNQAVCEGHRTLGRIAWHITCTIPEMAEKMGLAVEDFDYKAPVPATAKEIVEAYMKVSRDVLENVKLDWDDDTFNTEVDMYGQKWTRGFGMHACVEHEIHHRGQMTVLMRQAGIRVPSLYGPAKEDWAQMDMEPPAV